MDALNDQSDELIEQYLLGELKGEALRAFEARLETDPELRTKTEERKELFEMLERIEFRKTLNDLRATRKAASSSSALTASYATKNRKRLYRVISLAAALLVLISVPLFLIYQNNSNKDRLVEKYFEPYDNVLTFRGDEDDILVQQSMQAYDRGNWNECIERSEKALRQHPESTAELMFYIGVAALAEGRGKKAVYYLSNSETTKSKLAFAAEWYLALAYLKIRKKDKAVVKLRQIKSSGSSYASVATELLRELE